MTDPEGPKFRLADWREEIAEVLVERHPSSEVAIIFGRPTEKIVV